MSGRGLSPGNSPPLAAPHPRSTDGNTGLSGPHLGRERPGHVLSVSCMHRQCSPGKYTADVCLAGPPVHSRCLLEPAEPISHWGVGPLASLQGGWDLGRSSKLGGGSREARPHVHPTSGYICGSPLLWPQLNGHCRTWNPTSPRPRPCCSCTERPQGPQAPGPPAESMTSCPGLHHQHQPGPIRHPRE